MAYKCCILILYGSFEKSFLHKIITEKYNICALFQAIGAACLGWKVHIDSSDGDYVGYICWMLEHCGRLGLAEVRAKYKYNYIFNNIIKTP